MSSIVNTIVHELVHAVDKAKPEQRFGHGDNDSEGKDDSAPYWIGSLAACSVNNGGNPSQCDEDEISNIAKAFIAKEGELKYELIELPQLEDFNIID